VLHHRFEVKKVEKNILILLISLQILYLGWIWTKNAMTADNWLLDVKLRVTGRGRVGADGMVKDSFLEF
jgi:hypothetical protein